MSGHLRRMVEPGEQGARAVLSVSATTAADMRNHAASTREPKRTTAPQELASTSELDWNVGQIEGKKP